MTLPNDYSRCADSTGCPQAGRCERTAPAFCDPAQALMFNANRLAQGWCPAYMPIPERCTEDE
ncbi:MAG: hypothetical protein NUV51_09995 [Sulfuricaulis sp.]|nr:hypothetical protein [Sulfuricaulis sp.]